MSIKITLSLLFAFCFIAGLQGAAPQKESYLNLPSDMFGELVRQLVGTGSFEAAAHSIENLAQANQLFMDFFNKNKDYITKMLLDRWGITTPQDAQKKLNQLAKSGPASGLAVAALLRAGADVNKDYVIHTPLVQASDHGNKEMVWLLIKAGAKVNQEDYLGVPPLNWAAARGHIDIVNALLEVGANPNITNRTGTTPLINAVEFANRNMNKDTLLAIVNRLIDAGANLDMADQFGKTALIWAADNRYPSIVNRLLDAGANPDIKDNYGKTARDYERKPIKLEKDPYGPIPFLRF